MREGLAIPFVRLHVRLGDPGHLRRGGHMKLVARLLLGKTRLLERTGHLPLRPFMVARNGLSAEGTQALERAHGFSLDLAAIERLFDTVRP